MASPSIVEDGANQEISAANNNEDKNMLFRDEVAGPSEVVSPFQDTKETMDIVEIKAENVGLQPMDADSDLEDDNNSDDSDFEVKQEDEKSEGSEEDENYVSENEKKNNKNKFSFLCEEDIGNEYQSVVVKSYSSITVKEEPMDHVKNMFKTSNLEYEKIKYHQQIFEKILETSSDNSKLKDIQAQYLAQLRDAVGIEIYTCTICQYDTMSLPNLNCHFLAVHNGKREHTAFKCNKCNYESSSKTLIKKHLHKMHKKVKNIKNKSTGRVEKEKYPCSECSYQGRTEDGLQRHFKTTHKTNKSKCDLCMFQSEDKEVLKNHKNTHKKGGDFYCYKCPYRNGSKLTLALHLLKEHQIDNEMSKRSKICEICSLPCTSITKLKRHYLSHVKITELDESQIWKCPEPGCNYQSKTKNNLNLHVRTHKEPEFMCEICGFATKRKESYKWHLQTHKKLSEIEWIPCSICPYQARTKRHMYQHMKIGVHDGKNRRHIRKRNLQAEGIPLPDKSVRNIKNIYIEATTEDVNRKPKKKRRPRAKKKLDTTVSNDPILNFEELARAIVKNEIN